MKLVFASVLFALLMLSGVRSRKTDPGYIQHVEKSLKKGFVNLPFGYGMVILPNFTQSGSYTDDYFSTTTIDVKTNLVVLRGLESTTTNGQCDTTTTSYSNITLCNFTIPTASLQIVTNVHIAYKYFGGFNKDLEHRHFIGTPTAPLNGTFSLEKIFNPKILRSDVLDVKVNPVEFNYGKASSPKEQAIYQVLQKYGPDARLTYPLDHLLPSLIQNGLNIMFEE